MFTRHFHYSRIRNINSYKTMSEPSSYRWKGKIVTKRVYEQRCAQRKSGRLRKSGDLTSKETEANQANLNNHTEDVVGEEIDSMHGRRIVEYKTLGEQLWCVSCKEVLSLQYIENERRRGLGSQLLVRCHRCLLLNEVLTGKTNSSCDKRSMRFDINYKAVSGALHSGMGWTHLSKLFACMNIPCFDFKTFKSYEQLVGIAAEEVAKSSCEDATPMEKKLTVEKADSITKLL